MKHIFFGMMAILLIATNAMATQPLPTPDQIHLTWTGDPATTVTIQWRTDLSQTGSVVNYGLTKNNYTMNTSGTSFILSGQTITDPSYKQVVMLHRVTLQGLSPSTTYHYQVGSNSFVSQDYYFTTAPKTGSNTPFNFIAVGDDRGNSLGTSAGINPSLSTFAATLLTKHPAFILYNGDLTSQGHIDEMDDWFRAMSVISPYVVVMPANGNHEFYSPAFYMQFDVPLANGRSDQQLAIQKGFYYSFNYGNAHFTVLDDQYLFFGVPVQTTERTWLKQDLQTNHSEWKFVSHHEAEFAAGGHDGNTVLQQYWVPLYYDYDVDMSFTAHDHFYERTYPLDKNGVPVNGAPTPGTITYIVAGSIGAPLYDVEKASFIAYEEKTYNYVVVHVAGDTLSMDAYRLNETTQATYDTLMDSIPAYTKIPPVSASAGCGCSMAGDKGNSGFDILAVLMLLTAGLFIFKSYYHKKHIG